MDTKSSKIKKGIKNMTINGNNLTSDFRKGTAMRPPVMKFKMLELLAILILVMVVYTVAVAENGYHENTKDQEVLTDMEKRMMKKISIDFRNTPIEDVLRIMAEQADVDIVKSPNVMGNVTATLTNVPLKEALDSILTSHGYAYVASENMIRVAPVGEIAEKAERLTNRIYRITYADVIQVENALKKFISGRGSLSSNPGTSNIIVTDTETKIKAIDTFIEEIDRITPQILVEVRIYDVTSTDGFDLGAEWLIGRNTPITDVSIDDLSDVDQTINHLTGATTTHTTTKDYDVDKTIDQTWMNTAGYYKSDPFVGGSFDEETGGTISFGFLDTIDAEITLNVLRTNVGAKLLANPRILVLDNETASFEIISEIPYTEQSSTSEGGAMTSIKFKPVGVKLNVTPHVTREGMVRLHIVPEFGVVSEEGEKGAGTDLGTVPTVDNRKINTKALVQDGQTVVIGGLRKREVSQDVSKIPLLCDIPIIGRYFFTDVEESVETNELFIFITPKIVIKPTLTPEEIKGYEATNFPGPRVIQTKDELDELAKLEAENEASEESLLFTK